MGTRSELLIGPMAPGRWRQRLSAELMNDMSDLQAASWSPSGHSNSNGSSATSTPVVASRATWGRHSPSTFKSYVTMDNVGVGGRSSPPPTGPASLSLSAVTTPDLVHKSRFASKSPSRISRHGELVYRVTAPRSPSPHRTELSPTSNRLSPSAQPTLTSPPNKPVAPVACLSARIRALSARCFALLGDRAGAGLRSRRSVKHNTVVKQRSISWGALPGLEPPRQTLTADIDVDGDHDDNDSTNVSSTATSTNTNDHDEVPEDRGLRSASLDRHLIIAPPVTCTHQKRPGCSETLRIRRSTSPSEISEIFTKFQKRRVSGNTPPESTSTFESPASTPTSSDTSPDNEAGKEPSETASGGASYPEDEVSHCEAAESAASQPESLPPRQPRRSSQPTPPRCFRLVRLTRSTPDEELGVLIARNETAGFVIAHVLPSGLADRSGQLHAGDELVIVNGRQLRGLSMAAAKNRLRAGPFTVDLLVATPAQNAECICKKGEDDEKRDPDVKCPRCKGDGSTPKRGRSLTESSVDYENVMIRSKSSPSDTACTTTVVEFTGPRELHKQQLFQKHGGSRSCRRSLALSVDSSSSSSSSSRSSPPMHPSLKRQRPRRRSPSGTVTSLSAVASCGVGSAATFVVELKKGPGCAPLGFTVVGGADSPRGELGIFVRSLLEGGQAGADGRLQPGDELLSLNGQVLRGATHAEALAMFRAVKSGPVHLRVCRRASRKSQSCSDLVAGGNKETEE